MRHFIAVTMAGSLLLASAGVRAASFTWTQLSSGSYTWSTTSNWAGGIAPPVGGAADATVVLFPDSATLVAPGTRISTSNDLGSGGTFNLNTLSIRGWFNNSSASQAPATFGTASYALSGATLNFTGTNPTVNYHPSAYPVAAPQFYAGNPYVQINSNVSLSADTLFYTTDAGTTVPGLWVNGVVSGPGRLTWSNQEYANFMNLALTGPNTFTGGVTVGNAGSNRAYLLLASDASLGAVPGAAVADNLRLAGRIQPLNTGDLTLNANRGVTLFATADIGGGFIGPSGSTGWLIYGGKTTGAKQLQLSGNVRLTGTTSDFGVPGSIGTARGLYTADASIDVVKLADEGQPSSAGSYGKHWFDGGGGATLRYLGTGDSTNRTYAGDKNMVFDAAGSGTIYYTGLLDWSAGGGVTFTGASSGVSSGALNLAGNHTLAKSGVGDWTISGTANFTGNTSATTLSNGRLTLDYRTVNADKINGAAALTMGSAGATATLTVQGSNAADTVQKVTTGTTLAADSGSIFNVTSGTGAQNASLVLVALTRGGRSTVEINYANPGTGAAYATTSTANNAAGILGGWAVVNGSDWGRAGTANVNGGNNIVALAAYTGALPTTGGVTTDNDTLGASQAQTGAATVNSLKISDSGASQSLDLNGNNVTFTSTNGGLLYVGGTSNSFTVRNTGALAYIGGGTANEFLVNVKNGAALDIGARLIGAGTTGSLTKFGGGTLVVSSGANNYTGGTTVTSGTLKLGAANAIPSSGTFTLGTGTTFDLAGFGVTTGNIQGFGTITNSGASDVLFTIGNTTNNLTFGGVIQDGTTNKVSVALNGQAQNLAGLNTYTGATTVNGGTLNVTNLADGGLASGIGKSSNAAANLILNGGTLGYTGAVNAATDRNLTLNTTGGGLSASGGSTSTVVTFHGNIVPAGVAASRTLTLTGSSIGVLNGTTADFGVGNVTALIKSAGGTWVLNGANGYTGITTVNGGVLRANDGVGLPTASPMTISAGVFETGADLTRTLGTAVGNVRISGGTSGFSANGSAPVTVAIGGTGSPTAMTWGAADFAPTTLVLNETTANQNLTFANPVDLNAATRTVNVNATTGAVYMTGVLSNSSGTAGLTKGGAGVLVLTNNSSSFNGRTTVSLGMLAFTSIGNVAAGNSALGNPSDSTTGTIALGSGANTAALQYLGPTASTNRVIDLAGTTGGVMIESSGSGPLTFTNAFTATGNGAKTLYLAGNTGGKIQGAIVNSTGTTAVAKSGTGVWELSGANAFTGGLTIRSGVLRAREASIPSTGGLTLNGSNPNNLASVWESDQDIIRGVNATPTAGNLLLTTSNGYAPVGFSARGGNINVNLGSGTALTWGSSGFLGNQQRFLLNESTADSTITFQNSLSFNAQGPTNVFIVVNAPSADATAATMSGVLSSGGLTKQGPGLLILSNAANSFAGGLTIQEGTLRVGAAGALPNSNTLIVTAGTLDLATAGVSTTAASLTLGGGAAGTAAMVATGSGTLTLGGTLTYNGSTANDNGATVSGNLSLTADRNFTINDSLTVANDLTIGAAISSTGAFGVIKNNAGTLLLSGANSYTGGTSDTGGDLRIGGASGALTGTSGITLSGVGTRFTIDNSAAVSSSRVRDAATVNLGVGTDFRLVGGAGGNVNETIGAMGLSDGHMTISLTAVPTTGAALTFASINRPYGQTMLIRGSNLGQGTVGTAGVANLLFTDATGITTNYFKGGTGTPITTQKVITFMVGDTSPTGLGSDLVTYDANGVRALSLAAGEYTTTITDGQTQLDNVRLTAPVSLANSSTINALLVGAGGGVTIASGKTLTINSGVITPVGDNVSISGGTITSANTVIVNASRDVTISSAINGQLYKGGFATLTLAGPLTGIDRLHTGVLRMGAANVLPPTGSLSANAGTLLFDLNGYDQTIAGNGGWTMQVSNTSATYATLTTTSGLQGTITGNLNIKYTGTGTLAINGGIANNAWTGTTQATDGTISMSGGHSVSPWSVFRLGDTDGSSGILDISGSDATIAGLSIVGGTTNAVGNSSTGNARTLTVRTLGSDYTFSGVIKDVLGTGNRTVGVAKAGIGKQTLSGANTYTGATAVNGGTLELDYTTGNNNAKIATGSVLTLGGGTLSIVGNVGGGFTQTVGSTTVAAGASGVAQTSGATPLNLNVITRSVAGGTVDFSKAGAADITTDSNNSNGILGGWATFGGADWAQSVTSGAADTPISAYSAYNTNADPTTWAATDNVSLGASPSANLTTRSINSLRFGAASTLSITGLQTLTLTSGGMLVTGSGAVNVTGGGTLKGAGTAPRDLMLIQNSTADLTIDAVIEDNSAATALTKSGTGRLLLNGNNVYTGTTYLNSGTTRLGYPTALGTIAGGTTVAVGATLDLNGQAIPAEPFTVSGPGFGNTGALINSSATAPVTVGGTVTLSGYDAAIGGAGNITINGVVGSGVFVNFLKVGNGTVTLNGVNTYTGQTQVNGGTLAVNGSISASSRGVWVGSSGTLSGSGTIGGTMPFSISGAGLVSPGGSPGILTTTTVDVTQGLDFAFEFGATGSPLYSVTTASVNDVLRITGAYPFPFPLTPANLISVYLNVPSFGGGDLFRGGFYTDNYGDFLSRIQNASFAYYVRGDGNGPVPFNGVNYYSMSNYYPMLVASFSTVADSAAFSTGTASGSVSQWSFVVPEPSALLLVACGILALPRGRRREA